MDPLPSPLSIDSLARRPTLLAVPNFSEGANVATIEAIARACVATDDKRDDSSEDNDNSDDNNNDSRNGRVRMLDRHSDGDHNRTVYTLAGAPGLIAEALLKGAAEAISLIDVMSVVAGDAPRGQHPHVGALDVAPIVYLDAGGRGAACAEALVLADRIGHELEVPVFLYGELGGGRSRAELRSGGVARLAQRIATGELRPDYGPARLHPRAGATLVAARAPLVAFNLRLAPPASVEDARRIAALIREGGPEGLPGLRALGIALSGGVGQVSMNVERPSEVPLAKVVEAVSRHARVSGAELVGLAPRAALEGFPDDIPLSGFDPARHVIERALGL